MQTKTTIAGLCALIAAFAVTAARAESAEPKGFSCNFASGTTWTFDNGAFASEKPEAIDIEISDVDLDRQTAKLAGEAGKPAGALKIVRAINANHFLEVVNEGFLNLTTIYDTDPTSGTHPAVHSRHFGVLGQPVVAQYVGTCTEK